MILNANLSRRAALVLGMAAALPVASQALEEVPFVTSPDNVTLEMLQSAQVGASDYVIDLGSGDGRIVTTAAKRFGARGLGVEIVPELVKKSKESAQTAGVADKVEFREQDIFKTDLSQASVITMYLLPDVNLQLRPSILALKPGTRIVSHDWDMGDWKPDRTTVVPVPDKKVGLEKSSKIHLWVVPAQVQGLWCGTGLLKGTQIAVEQKFQSFTATMTLGSRVREYEGTIDGTLLRSLPTARRQITLELKQNQLHLVAGDGPVALLKGSSLALSSSGSCEG